jgi:hypothetical protein
MMKKDGGILEAIDELEKHINSLPTKAERDRGMKLLSQALGDASKGIVHVLNADGSITRQRTK